MFKVIQGHSRSFVVKEKRILYLIVSVYFSNTNKHTIFVVFYATDEASCWLPQYFLAVN